MPKPSTGPGRGSATRKPSSSRPLGRQPQRIPAQTKSPARLKLERLSIRPLHFFQRMPRLILPILMAAFLLLGLLLPTSIAGIFLLILGAFLGWLLALSWPALTPGSRYLRLAVTVAVVAAAFWRFAGYG